MLCFVYYVKQRYVMLYRVMLCYITIIRYIKSNSNVGMLLRCPRLQKLRLNIVKYFLLKKEFNNMTFIDLKWFFARVN